MNRGVVDVVGTMIGSNPCLFLIYRYLGQTELTFLEQSWDAIGPLVYKVAFNISCYGNFLSQEHRENQLVKNPNPLQYQGYCGYGFRRAPLMVVSQDVRFAGANQDQGDFYINAIRSSYRQSRISNHNTSNQESQ